MNTHVDLFTGEVNEHVAHVYVRLPRTNPGQKITGRVRGPFNALGSTLPANATLKDLGPGDTVLARAIVTDPCTWTPDSPSLYKVEVDLVDGDNTTRMVHDQFGIRRCAARSKSLYLDARRWVPRGVRHPAQFIDQELLSAYRDQAATLVTTGLPGDACLRTASSLGIAIIADLSASQVTLSTLQTCARYPCVLLAVLGQADLPEQVKSLIPNLVLAQRWRGSTSPAPWADVAWLDAADVAMNCVTLPVIAEHHSEFASLAEGRAACDQLQAQLAPQLQCAGYVIGKR